MKLLIVAVPTLFLSACTYPMLKVSPSQSTATVLLVNSAGGTTQQYFFEDPVSCKGPSIIGAVDGLATRSVTLPAGRVITIWTSAWGLPAPYGKIAWCKPSAFSTRLVAGRTYRVRFNSDSTIAACGVTISSLDDPNVRQVVRRVDGPEIAGGPLTKAFSCDANDDLRSLDS